MKDLLKTWLNRLFHNMIRSIILDTNIFLRYILNDIPKDAKRAEKLLTESKDGKLKIFVPQIVIFEINFALDKYYQIDKDKIVTTLVNLITSEYLEIQDRTVFLSAMVVFKNKNISFVDAFLLALSDSCSAELITHDKKLKS